MKTKFDKPYNQKFVAKILQGDKDLSKGKGEKISLKKLRELCK